MHLHHGKHVSCSVRAKLLLVILQLVPAFLGGICIQAWQKSVQVATACAELTAWSKATLYAQSQHLGTEAGTAHEQRSG